MNAAVKEDEASTASTGGPGRQLRLVREEQGLDLGRVAVLLHLSEEKLAALEADRYEELPGAVFVQGYLRNYARLLSVPVDPLLNAFHKLNHGHERPPELRVSQVQHEVRSSHALVRLMTWVIVIGLIALVVIWWRGYLQWPLVTLPGEPEVPALTSEETDIQSAQPAVIPPDSSVETPVEFDESGEATLALPARPALEAENEAAAAQEEPDKPPSLPQADAAGEGMLLALPPAAEQEEIQQQPLPTESRVEPEPEAPAEAIAVASARVVIEYSDTSWTEIRDASGSFKILGEIGAGSRRVLGGSPPYKLVLGNASAVSITVDGKPFDLTPYIRGKVARLTLNPDQ